MINLSVVIPCYNEEQNIRKGKIEQVISFLKKQDYVWELIIVDDGSIDGSGDIIEKIIEKYKNVFLIKNPHQGKAATVISGMLKGNGKYILFTDLDQATPIEEVDQFLKYLKEGWDIIIGSRNDRRQGAPFIRAVMGPVFTFLRKIILGLDNISDTQCGFKAFKKEVAHKLFKKINLYKKKTKLEGSQVTAGFDVEILFLAQKLGFTIKEVPVKWHYVETRRVNPIKDSLSAFFDLIKIKLNDINGVYD